jgi:hypothetical protein
MKDALQRISAIFAGLLVLAVTASAAPQLRIEEDTFDFGYVPQNSQISHIFWLKSVGTDTVKILKVVPG